jgi:hypothetical protein
MISKKLLDLILHKEDRLSQRWVDEVKKSPYMKSYQGHGEDELRTRNKKFFEYLAKWIDEGVSGKKQAPTLKRSAGSGTGKGSRSLKYCTAYF